METDQLYHTYKPLLFSLAYRMMGSVMDAEDIVQEAFLSFSEASAADQILNKKAYLCKIVTNRCLDLLRSSAKKRELYVGPWLPEPIVGGRDRMDGSGEANDPSRSYLRKEAMSTAYLLLLHQLTAVERAYFCCARYSSTNTTKSPLLSARAARTAGKFFIARSGASVNIRKIVPS